jgi:hypothetical protein
MPKFKIQNELSGSGRRKRQKLLKNVHTHKNTSSQSLSHQSDFPLDTLSESEDEHNESISPSQSHSPVPTQTLERENESSLRQNLANWAVMHRVNRNAVSSLLKVLNSDHNELPLDYRSLLETPRNVEVKDLSPGQVIYLSLESAILKVCENLENIPDTLFIDCNIDGAPLFENSVGHGDMWPILCRIENIDSPVFAVAIYVGPKKPGNFQKFLEPFIDDFLQICNSIIIKGSPKNLIMQRIILDAPARSSICAHNGHTGKIYTYAVRNHKFNFYSCSFSLFLSSFVSITLFFFLIKHDSAQFVPKMRRSSDPH